MWGILYLTEEQKIARRANLDWAGYHVVLSQIVVCIFIFVYRGFTLGPTQTKNSLAKSLKRLEWKLSDPLSLAHPEFRCLGDWLVVLAWISWCAFLAIPTSSHDYLHLTKAFGAVAAANLPLHFMLAMKRSPLRWIYGLSYERANFLHRWLGRTIYYCLCTHAALYLSFFWSTDRMKTRFLEFDVLCGFFAIIALTTIILSSNHYIRNVSYRTFYLIHITLSPLLFPLMFFHVSHLRPYLFASIILFAGDQLLRYFLRTPAIATIERLTSNLIQISAHAAFETALKPGSHAFIRHPETCALTSNPFSITAASTPSGTEKKRIRMVARIRGNFTKQLASLPTLALEPCDASPDGIKKVLAVYLDLPYGASLYFPDLKHFDKIMFIAGGVGATFAVSWVKYLFKSSENKPSLVRQDQLRFVWAVKTPEEALWALEDDYPGDNAADVAKCLELYITGSAVNGSGDDGEDGDGIEMTEGLLRGRREGSLDAAVRAGVERERISIGRPALRQLIQDTVKAASDIEGRSAILVCGPAMMGSVTKRVTANLGMDGADIWLHVEEFGY